MIDPSLALRKTTWHSRILRLRSGRRLGGQRSFACAQEDDLALKDPSLALRKTTWRSKILRLRSGRRIDRRNSTHVAVLGLLRSLGMIKEPKTPYKKEFVDKIKQSEKEFSKGESKKIKTAGLWK